MGKFNQFTYATSSRVYVRFSKLWVLKIIFILPFPYSSIFPSCHPNITQNLSKSMGAATPTASLLI